MQQLDINTFHPRMRVLNKKQAEAIHQAALEILERTGFRMENETARKMLLDSGCRTDQDDWLHMPSYLVENALASAPRQITLYDQQGNRIMPLFNGTFYYGTGSDTIFTIDPETRQRRRTVLEDSGNFAKVVDALPNIDFAMSMGNPEDVPVEEIYVQVFAEMVRNTNKPICFIADRKEDMDEIHRIASCVAGSEAALQERPFLLNYSEAISPLRFPSNVIDKLMFCADKGIPVCLPSGCNAGGGAPVTLAGAMALGIAENLVGLTVHQLAGKGAPFLFAPNVSVLDMKHTIISYGCTEWSLTQAAFADMRDYLYKLPIWAFAGATDAKTVDAQAGAEGMLSIITSMLSRCNFIHDVGYIEHGNTSSLEMLILSDEMIGMSRFFVDGISINDETLGLDTIHRIAKSNDNSIFLSDPHTFKNFKSAHYHPEIMDRSRFDLWEKTGGKDTETRCNDRVNKILQNHKVTKKSAKLEADINALLQKRTRSAG